MEGMTEGQHVRLGTTLLTDSGLFLLKVDDPDQLPPRILLPSERFMALVIWDCQGKPSGQVIALAETLLNSGVSFVCSSGRGATLLESAVDSAFVGRQLDGTVGKETLLMTTSHEMESLDEALWFFLNCAHPDDSMAAGCKSLLVLQIGGDEQAISRVEFALTHPSDFSDDVLPP